MKWESQSVRKNIVQLPVWSTPIPHASKTRVYEVRSQRTTVWAMEQPLIIDTFWGWLYPLKYVSYDLTYYLRMQKSFGSTTSVDSNLTTDSVTNQSTGDGAQLAP
jgi:hypothetical protein